jgi:hypothetical protein
MRTHAIHTHQTLASVIYQVGSWVFVPAEGQAGQIQGINHDGSFSVTLDAGQEIELSPDEIEQDT